MLREIYEQPDALARTLEQYVADGRIQMKALTDAAECFRKHKDLVIAASGSSRHAGLAAEIMLEDAAGLVRRRRVRQRVHHALHEHEARPRGAGHLAVRRDRGHTRGSARSEATQASHARRHQRRALIDGQRSRSLSADHAGVERAIPATKSFTAQLLVLRLLSLEAADARGAIDAREMERQLAELWEIPPMIERQLDGWRELTDGSPLRYSSAKTLLYLGRGIHYAIAREGALKLKESSYMHAEGYPAGELKHGPNALVSDEVPIVALATVDWQDAESVLRYEKSVALLNDLKAQGARTIVLGNTGDAKLREVASDLIEVEPANEYLLPITEVVPLQLFAYFMALENGVDVDRPRNLVKAVVQE